MGLSNPYLQWEETRKLQFGLDLGFFNDKILINSTYARNRSSNQLLTYALPYITGQSGIYQNFPANIQNTSWEFMLTTINTKSKNFTWSSSLNLTASGNKLLAFPNLSTSTYAGAFFIGKPTSFNLYYHFLGTDPATGEYIVADANGKPTTTPNYLTDRTIFQSTLPKFYGGFQNSISYKGLQLDILFQFVKQKAENVLFANSPITFIYPGGFFPGNSNQPITVLDRWQKPGDITTIQRYSTILDAGAAVLSDAVFSDASYIRLKNISISWQLPERWKQRGHLQQCRIYIQGQNLFTATNYQGLDPETQNVKSLPPLKLFTIGFQVGL